jgi:hypothetical protein
VSRFQIALVPGSSRGVTGKATEIVASKKQGSGYAVRRYSTAEDWNLQSRAKRTSSSA